MLTDLFLCHCTSTEGTGSQSSAYKRKHYHLFKQKVLSAHICKNTLYFAWSKPLQKCWTGETFGHLS